MRFVDFYNSLSPEELTSLGSCIHKRVYRSPRPEGLEVLDEDGCHLAVIPHGDESLLHKYLENHECLTVYTHVIWKPDQAKIEALGELEDVIREHVYGVVLKKWNSGSPCNQSKPLLSALERVGVVYKTETINTYTELF